MGIRIEDIPHKDELDYFELFDLTASISDTCSNARQYMVETHEINRDREAIRVRLILYAREIRKRLNELDAVLSTP